ncbi:MAG: hypothetical protein J0L66_14895 [Cytophagales bacterium]|nr:hypothetical protein [Cytophagales bacterium]
MLWVREDTNLGKGNMQVVDQLLQLLLMLVVTLLAWLNVQHEWLHKAVAIIIIATLTLSIIVEWNVWLIE